VSFQQAAIRVEREKEFQELKDAVKRAFEAKQVERFLKRVQSASIRIREWDSLLSKGVFEQTDKVLADSGKTAQSLYQAVSLSDQAQIREFYLFRVEEVEPKLRTKFHKLYQYY